MKSYPHRPYSSFHLGECIPLANKCNSRIDCDDESDESSCSYLEVIIFFVSFVALLIKELLIILMPSQGLDVQAHIEK